MGLSVLMDGGCGLSVKELGVKDKVFVMPGGIN